MKYTLGLVVGLLLFASVAAKVVFAACQPIFGGGTSCTSVGSLQIEKRIIDPQTGTLTDTPDSFAPNEDMTFQLDVKNTGGSTVKNVTIQDTFPTILTFVSGPGSYALGNRVLTITIDTLKGKETKTFTVKAKTKDITQSKICSFNHAEAVSGKNNASDNIQFCIETDAGVVVTGTSTPDQTTQPSQTKGGISSVQPQTQSKAPTQPVFPQPTNSKTPATGPEMWSLISLIPAGLAGWTLRKKTKIH